MYTFWPSDISQNWSDVCHLGLFMQETICHYAWCTKGFPVYCALMSCHSVVVFVLFSIAKSYAMLHFFYIFLCPATLGISLPNLSSPACCRLSSPLTCGFVPHYPIPIIRWFQIAWSFPGLRKLRECFTTRQKVMPFLNGLRGKCDQLPGSSRLMTSCYFSALFLAKKKYNIICT